MNYEPLTNPETDGFRELVDAMHDALDDLLGVEISPLDHAELAVELADTAWKQLLGDCPECHRDLNTKGEDL